jgi:arylsulfatase A-like enzyme
MYGTTGHHRMNGLVICWRPGMVKEGEEPQGARIQDLAPTILYLLGQPIPRNMDGRVLLEVLEPGLTEGHPVTYAEGEETLSPNGEAAYSDEEQAEMREMLRGLGYVT